MATLIKFARTGEDIQGVRVSGGKPGTEDYDEGRIIDVLGNRVVVAWESGVRTELDIDACDDLTVI